MNRGRKRKAAVLRTPKGRISRAVAAQDANLEPLLLRQRMFGLSEKDARDQKAATVIGRLNLGREISDHQYDAAMEMLRIRDAYLRAIKAPDGLRNATGSGTGLGETEAYARWCQVVVAKYEAASRAVVSENSIHINRGCNLWGALDYVVFRDAHFEHLVGDLRIALNALVHHFGLSGLTGRAKQSIQGLNSTVHVV